jgi:hypothetical protein
MLTRAAAGVTPLARTMTLGAFAGSITKGTVFLYELILLTTARRNSRNVEAQCDNIKDGQKAMSFHLFGIQ